MDSLYSIVGKWVNAKDHHGTKTDRIMEEQSAILEIDDIVDYDSDASEKLSIDKPKDEIKSADCNLHKVKKDPVSISPCEPEIIVID